MESDICDISICFNILSQPDPVGTRGPYQHQNIKTRSRCILWNYDIELWSFSYLSAQFCLPKKQSKRGRFPDFQWRVWAMLGAFSALFQQEPVLSDHFFSFCFIWKMSNQVPIEKSWNCKGNLLWRFVPYYWVLWKPVFQRASQNVKIGFHCF